MADATFRVFRGDAKGGDLVTYAVPVTEGMVVLDGIHYIQAHLDGALACRWNCKAARCGSCSAEINGHPRLMCKTRVDDFKGEPITVRPMKVFPVIKDLVSDVSWNYRVNAHIPPFTPSRDDPGPWKLYPEDVERLFEFRKCIECFLCQDVCHVLREHDGLDRYMGPRFMVRVAALEMHPKDTLSRTDLLRGRGGIGFCNVTKCCEEVCPEHIHITDNAIIPLKERMADDYFDPWRSLLRVFGKKKEPRGT
jgi:succinate dehydrogenase / fumarate reductase, iron-sulfur subunit